MEPLRHCPSYGYWERTHGERPAHRHRLWRRAAAAPPDRALVSLSAEVRAENPGGALAVCSEAAAAMVDAALAAGVVRSAVQTSGLSLQPWWDHGRGEARLAGYQAADSLSMRVADLDRIGALLAAVVAAGGEAATTVRGASWVREVTSHGDEHRQGPSNLCGEAPQRARVSETLGGQSPA